MDRRRVTVQEAADALGISVDAVRQRIRRKHLERAEPEDPGDNRVYVWLDMNQTEAKHGPSEAPQLVESLLDQVHYLREQLAAERRANDENRRLLAAALERIPAIEAPAPPESPEPREEPETHPERPERAEPAEPVDPEREEPERVPPERVEPERTEPRESPITFRVGRERADTGEEARGQQEATERPWWRRVFGG